jgi:hypothetical protein
MFARFVLPLLVAASIVPGGVAYADESWQRIAVKDGVTYDKRAVSGSKFLEYRAVFEVQKSLSSTLTAIWDNANAPPGAHVRKRTFLKKTADELLFHDDLAVKVVSDRELNLRMWKEPTAVRFETRNDLGPPAQPGHVLLPAVRGSWVLEPVSGGGTKVTYMCYSEPGGSVPAFLVRGSQQDQVGKDVEHVRAGLE